MTQTYKLTPEQIVMRLFESSEPVNEEAAWLALTILAANLYLAHQALHGLTGHLFSAQSPEARQPFLYAALAATGLVDQVRRDVARHVGIAAAEAVLASRHGVPLVVLRPVDHETCRRLADAAMAGEKLALEGTLSNQHIVRALVMKIQGLWPVTRQVEATVEPGGTVTLDAEVRDV